MRLALFFGSMNLILRIIIFVIVCSISIYICIEIASTMFISHKFEGESYLIVDSVFIRVLTYFITVILISFNIIFAVFLFFIFPFVSKLESDSDEIDRMEIYYAKKEKEIANKEKDLANLETMSEQINDKYKRMSEEETRLSKLNTELIKSKINVRESELNIEKAKEKINNQRFKLKRKYGRKFIDNCDSETSQSKDFSSSIKEIWHKAIAKNLSYSTNENIIILTCLIKNKKYTMTIQMKSDDNNYTKTYEQFLAVSGLTDRDIQKIEHVIDCNFIVNVNYQTKIYWEYSKVSKKKLKRESKSAVSFRKHVES